MLSKLTLIGLHNYSKGAIWDNIDLPEGIEKELLINEILKENGEFCLIYPDLDFLTVQINCFFKKWYSTFSKWLYVLEEEYEPLFNVDVKTSTTEHGVNEDNSETNGVNRANRSGASNGTQIGNTGEVKNTSSGEGRTESGNGISNGNSYNTGEKFKAAYDANTYQGTEKEIGSGNTSMSNSSYNSMNASSTSSLSVSTNNSLSTSESESEQSSSTSSESMTANSEHTITTEEYKRGNQGVTMSQEMLLAELNVRRFNLYDQIADIFASEFCVTYYV